MVFHGKWYEEAKVGDSFGSSLTVTETHLVLAAGMFGDFNPLHVDEEFAKKSMFGGRILHGPFTGALVSAPVGNYFAGTAIAYLEHTCRFKAPVRAGDTLNVRATVIDLVPEKRRATLSTVITVGNRVVLEGEAVVIVPLRSSLPAAESSAARPR